MSLIKIPFVYAVLLAAVIFVAESSAQSRIAWNEAVNGAFSTRFTAPKLIALRPGTNSVLATIGGTNRDLFRFNVPKSRMVDAIKLTAYASTDPKSWIGVQAGSAWTAGDIIDAMRAQQHFGTANLGSNLLNISPAVPLRAGSYTVRAQQLGASTQYQLDIRLSAEPKAPKPVMIIVRGGTLPPTRELANRVVASFQLGKYEVTSDEWLTVRAWAVNNGYTDLDGVGGSSEGDSPAHPAKVGWYDAAKWCNAKSEMEGLTPVYLWRGSVFRTGQEDWTDSEWDKRIIPPQAVAGANGYRLPSLEEWEWAARGGVKSQGYTYSGSSDVNAVAWNKDNSSDGPRAVGTKAANELGIHDMSGNVSEWCYGAVTYTILRSGGGVTEQCIAPRAADRFATKLANSAWPEEQVVGTRVATPAFG